MTISAPDTATALVVIDLQPATIANSLVHPIGDVIVRAASLADAFRRRGPPVALLPTL